MKNTVLIIKLIVLVNKSIKCNAMYYCLDAKKEINAEGLCVPSVF